MKRIFALLLSALLLLGCLAPALALEPEEPADPPGELLDLLNAEDGGEDWDSYWAGQLRAEKEALGMPNPDGINVSLNGVYLDLKGAEPAFPDVEDMDLLDLDFAALPLRATLEAMGAKVDYQDGTITARLADGRTLTAALDSETLEVVRGDKITAVEMGGTPYVDARGATYLPAAALAGALGLGVSADMRYDAIHLTDWDALAAELDSHFICVNELLAASEAAVDREKRYAGTGTVTVAGTLYGETRHSTATMSVQVDSLQSGTCTSSEIRVRMDLDELRDTVLSGLPEEAWEELEQWNNRTLSVIYNPEEDTLYCRGFAPDGLEVPEDAWIRTGGGGVNRVAMTPSAVPGVRGRTLGAMLTQERTVYSYGQSPWEETMERAALCRLVLDDKNFTRTVSGDTVTYTARVNLLSLGRRAAELGLLEDLTLSELLDGAGDLPAVDLTLTARVKGEKLTAFSCKGTVKVSGAFPVETVIDVSGTPLDVTGEIAFKGAYLGKLEISMKSRAAMTEKEVPAEPPAGSEIVDLTELLASLVSE